MFLVGFDAFDELVQLHALCRFEKFQAGGGKDVFAEQCGGLLGCVSADEFIVLVAFFRASKHAFQSAFGFGGEVGIILLESGECGGVADGP